MKTYMELLRRYRSVKPRIPNDEGPVIDTTPMIKRARRRKLAKSETLDDLISRSKRVLANMTPEEETAMRQAQRESWARSMAPCKHGVVDWETCPECRKAVH